MCKIDWEVLHLYIDSLIWPSFILILILIFNKKLKILIDRVIKESDNIEIPGIFKAQFTRFEKLRKEIKESSQPTKEQAQEWIRTTVSIQVDAIRQLGEAYPDASYDQRRLIESQIKDYCIGLEVDDIEVLAKSKDNGHRIAAAIALESVLHKKETDPVDIEYVKSFIIESLDDSSSYLRYKILQLVILSKELPSEMKEKLYEMKEKDQNKAIRTMLKMYLK